MVGLAFSLPEPGTNALECLIGIGDRINDGVLGQVGCCNRGESESNG